MHLELMLEKTMNVFFQLAHDIMALVSKKWKLSIMSLYSLYNLHFLIYFK
jgi:hypothetical protein